MHRVEIRSFPKVNTIYEKNMWLCIILDGDRNVYNDDGSNHLRELFDYFVSRESDIGFFAVVKKKNKEAVFMFFMKRKNNDIKNGSEIPADPLFPVSLFPMMCVDLARSTRPDFRQDVQTYIFLEPPSVLTLTDFTFDFHIFGVFL